MESINSETEASTLPGRAAARTLAALAIFAVATLVVALILVGMDREAEAAGDLTQLPAARAPRLLMGIGEFALAIAPVAAMAQIGVASLRSRPRLGVLALAGVAITLLGVLIAR